MPRGDPWTGAGHPKDELKRRTFMLFESERAADAGPLEVAEYWMRFFHEEAILAAEILRDTPIDRADPNMLTARESLARSLIFNIERAVDCAKVVLPFREPRIAPRKRPDTPASPFPVKIDGDMTAREAQKIYVDMLNRIDQFEVS